MARVGSTLPNKAGSATTYNSTVTISSIQGLKTKIDKQLDYLEEAQLEVKNTCTRMVGYA